MEFEKIIRTELEELLGSHEFKVQKIDSLKIDFQSPKLTLRFIYDPYELSFRYWIKHKNFDQEFESWVIEKFLKLEWKETFEATTQEQMINKSIKKVSHYFNENPRNFLNGDDNFFIELNCFYKEQTEDYNNNLQLSFIRKQLNNAWLQNDYRKLANLDISGIFGITDSELKKIEIAKRKIKASNKP